MCTPEISAAVWPMIWVWGKQCRRLQSSAPEKNTQDYHKSRLKPFERLIAFRVIVFDRLRLVHDNRVIAYAGERLIMAK